MLTIEELEKIVRERKAAKHRPIVDYSDYLPKNNLPIQWDVALVWYCIAMGTIFFWGSIAWMAGIL